MFEHEITRIHVDAEDFEALQGCMQILEGIARGELAIQEGKTYTQAQAREKMSRWLVQ